VTNRYQLPSMVMLLAADEEVVMIEDEPSDVGHLVESLSGDFLDLVVGHVDDLEVLAVVDDPEDVPVLVSML
jgi:hypothetical protein